MIGISQKKSFTTMFISAFLFFTLFSSSLGLPYPNPRELHSTYWKYTGQSQLLANLNRQIVDKPAKNVILFLGDGMGFPVVTASRIFRGQSEGRVSDQDPFTFETFPFTGISKTYNADRHVTDSASAATAYLTGVKGNIKTIGVGPEAKWGECDSVKKYSAESIAAWAIREGKGAGVVTTTRVTHATPAALYAHVAEREWEDDRMMAACRDQLGHSIGDCKDIARQLIENFPGNKLKVVMGGGRKRFSPSHRLDGRDLIEEWRNVSERRSYIQTRDQLRNFNFTDVDQLLGLFAESHMEVELTKERDSTEPNILEMTQAALRMMEKEENGYFLLVEGGRIDQALHKNLAKAAFTETIWFDRAITHALQNTDPEETLIVVTADHSHVLDIQGYPTRDSSIFSYQSDSNLQLLSPQHWLVNNGSVPILTFANGPSSIGQEERIPAEDTVDTEANDYMPPAFIPREVETHGGEDVPVYATGPQAHLFAGVQENSFLPYGMGYALCVGPSKNLCKLKQYRQSSNEDRTTKKAFAFFQKVVTRFVAQSGKKKA